MKTKSISAILGMLLFTLATLPARAQATLTAVEGKVSASGKPIAGAQVVLTSETGRAFKTKADKTGYFRMVGVPRGNYDVEVVSESGDKLFKTKSSVTGEGGKAEFLALDIDENLGKGSAPKVSNEQMEAIKAQNAKAMNLNELITQYQNAVNIKSWQEAITALQGMVAIDGTRWDYYQALGSMQFNMAHYQDSIDAFEKAIPLAQNSLNDPKAEQGKVKAGIGQMLTTEGNAYIKMGKPKDAIAFFTRAAELDPNPGTAYFNLCATQYNAGDMEAAAASCDKAIKADPNKADAYFIKGSAMFGNGKLDSNNKYVVPPGTAEALNKYLELAPDGGHATDVTEMLKALGAKIETSYGKKKK